MREGITARPHKQRKLVRSMRKAATDRPGFMFDFSDLTEAKLAWRRNLLTETEFRNGLADAPVRGGLITPVAMQGYIGAIAFSHDGVTSSYAYKSGPILPVGSTYTFQFVVEMDDDLGPPVMGNSASTGADMGFITYGGISNNPNVVKQSLGGRRYLLSATAIVPSSTAGTFGLVKYLGQSTRTFKVTAYQLDAGQITPYQALTDAYTEFLASFPYHSLFREATLATPVMSLEDPVGGVLDMRFGGARSTLNIYGTNVPTFGSDWARTAEEFKHTPGSNSNLTFGAGGSAVVGRWYEFTFRVSGRTAGSVRGLAGSTSAGPYTAANGPYHFIGQCSGAPSMYINSDSLFDGTVSDINVREVYGNHAVQATVGDRPTISAKVNLVNASEDFTQSPWSKSTGIVINGSAYVAPSGRAASAVFHGGTGSSAISLAATTAKATKYHCIFCVRAGTAATLSIGLRDFTANAWTSVTAEILSGPGAVSGSGLCSVNGLTTEWTIIKLTTTADMTAGSTIGPFVYPVGTSTYATTQSVGVAFFQLAQGTVTLPYQRVGSATDYDYVGFAMGARFNGVNQYLRVVSNDPSAHTKAVVGLSMRKDSDAAVGIPMEHTVSYSSTVGGWAVLAPSDVNALDAVVGVNAGTPSARGSPAVYGSPRTLVVSSNLNMAGNNPVDRGDVRVNSLVASNRGLLGTSGVGTAKFAVGETFIGRRAGTGSPFNGMIYRAGARYGEYDATTSFLMDRWLNEKLGVLPSEVFLNTVSKWFTAANTPGRFEPGFRDWATSGTLFQDSSCAVPVTALEQGVGGRLDRSRGGARGPEMVTNTTPLVGFPAGGGTRYYSQAGNMVQLSANRVYEISYTVSGYSGTGNVGLAGSAPAGFFQSNHATDGQYRVTSLVTGAGYLSFYTLNTNTATFSNFSVREILGAHRIQATNTKRPVLSARKNMVGSSEAFNNAYWQRAAGGTGVAAVVTDNYAAGPLASGMASRVQLDLGGGTTATDRSYVSTLAGSMAVLAGTQVTSGFWVKATSAGDVGKTIVFRHVGGSGYAQVVLAADWQLTPARTETAVGGAASISIELRGQFGASNTADFLLFGVSLETGTARGRYQRTTTPTDYDSVGFPVGLRYDGLTMGMYTAAPIDYSATDKVTIGGPVRKESDSTPGVLWEHWSNSNTISGTFGLFSPPSVSPQISFQASGVTLGGSSITATGFPSPVSLVQIGIGDLNAATPRLLRANGAQVGSSGSPLGGSFVSAVNYEGSRAGTSVYFNGMIYGEFQIGKLLTASELTYLEAEFAKLLLEQ